MELKWAEQLRQKLSVNDNLLLDPESGEQVWELVVGCRQAASKHRATRREQIVHGGVDVGPK